MPVTDHPGRFSLGATLSTDEPVARRLRVLACRSHGRGLIVSFAEVDDREKADLLRGVGLTIAASERRPLNVDEFWPEDLEGLEVRSPAGERLGTVTAVVVGEAQDRLVVSLASGRSAEVPFVAHLVQEVQPEKGYLVVMPIEGLL